MEGFCALWVFVWNIRVQQLSGASKLKKITQTGAESFPKIKKRDKVLSDKKTLLSESLFEGLVHWGIGIQGRGTIVHELGGVVRGDRAEVAAVWRVGQAGHHCHHLCYLLLQLCDLLLPLVDLTWMRRRKQSLSFLTGKNFNTDVKCYHWIYSVAKSILSHMPPSFNITFTAAHYAAWETISEDMVK